MTTSNAHKRKLEVGDIYIASGPKACSAHPNDVRIVGKPAAQSKPGSSKKRLAATSESHRAAGPAHLPKASCSIQISPTPIEPNLGACLTNNSTALLAVAPQANSPSEPVSAVVSSSVPARTLAPLFTLSQHSFYRTQHVNLKGNRANKRTDQAVAAALGFVVTGVTMPSGPPPYHVFPLQQACWDSWDASGKWTRHLRAFSHELAAGGRRNYIATTPHSFWKVYADLQPQERHHYEVIRQGHRCHLYFDLEFQHEYNPGVDGAALVQLLLELVALQLQASFNIRLKESEWVFELDSSTDTKFSRHLTVCIKRCAFQDNAHVGAFVRLLLARAAADRGRYGRLFVRKQGGAETPFIDMSVYSRNRAFRLFLSAKAGKTALLLPTSRYASAKLYDAHMRNAPACTDASAAAAAPALAGDCRPEPPLTNASITSAVSQLPGPPPPHDQTSQQQQQNCLQPCQGLHHDAVLSHPRDPLESLSDAATAHAPPPQCAEVQTSAVDGLSTQARAADHPTLAPAVTPAACRVCTADVACPTHHDWTGSTPSCASSTAAAGRASMLAAAAIPVPSSNTATVASTTTGNGESSPPVAISVVASPCQVSSVTSPHDADGISFKRSCTSSDAGWCHRPDVQGSPVLCLPSVPSAGSLPYLPSAASNGSMLFDTGGRQPPHPVAAVTAELLPTPLPAELSQRIFLHTLITNTEPCDRILRMGPGNHSSSHHAATNNDSKRVGNMHYNGRGRQQAGHDLQQPQHARRGGCWSGIGTVQYGPCPYPLLHGFIGMVCNQGGVQGQVRSWLRLPDAEALLFNIRDNRWCGHIEASHKSNGVFYVVDLAAGVWHQRCYDPECRHYRSPAMPLPPDVWASCKSPTGEQNLNLNSYPSQQQLHGHATCAPASYMGTPHTGIKETLTALTASVGQGIDATMCTTAEAGTVEAGITTGVLPLLLGKARAPVDIHVRTEADVRDIGFAAALPDAAVEVEHADEEEIYHLAMDAFEAAQGA